MNDPMNAATSDVVVAPSPTAADPAPGPPCQGTALTRCLEGTAKTARREEAGHEDECERLLRNAKKQVKQMMEEAVTRKFVHEDSGSILSLCVAIEACLTHGLRRRALGLFKTNSSTALVQKAAKECAAAQRVLELAGAEESRLFGGATSSPAPPSSAGEAAAAVSGAAAPSQGSVHASARRSASNLLVHKRNMWIKVALMEKKLVAIMEHLAAKSASYYEQHALMANRLSAQLLCSLLVGPSALEFRRSRASDLLGSGPPGGLLLADQEPTADELLRRHKLANPAAVACPQCSGAGVGAPASRHHHSQQPQQQQHHGTQDGAGLGRLGAAHSRLARSATAASQQQPHQQHQQQHQSPAHQRVSRKGRSRSGGGSAAGLRDPRGPATATATTAGRQRSGRVSSCNDADEATSSSRSSIVSVASSEPCGPREGAPARPARRGHRPLAPRSSACHARGYSLFSSLKSGCAPFARTRPCSPLSAAGGTGAAASPMAASAPAATPPVADQNWPVWSPRVLHEILHQNSRSCLLFAKNNVLLETNTQQGRECLLPGYLSLHQTSADLLLKWIPNQMISGGESAGLEQARESRPEAEAEAEADLALGAHSTRTTPPPPPPAREEAVPELGSSYLELVVNIPVSRLVLLHCHFGRPASPAPLDSDAPQPDTLILVELDGVQRAPFKFPKGGLRSLLSCLETGLRPAKYLDPALSFASDSEAAADEPPGGSPTPTPAHSPGASSPSSSKLDLFFKRLPSFKQRRRPAAEQPTRSCSDGATPRPLDATRVRAAPGSCVYRILPAADWPAPAPATPPHSAPAAQQQQQQKGVAPALSMGQQLTRKQQQQHSVDNHQQLFRWTLGRLARFSPKYARASLSTTSSNLSSQAGPSPSSQQTGTLLSSVGSETDAPELPRPDGPSCDLSRIQARLDHLNRSEELRALRTQSIQTLCESMRRQIVERAFYGWLAHCRRAKIVRTHLVKLVNEAASGTPVVGAERARRGSFTGSMSSASSLSWSHDTDELPAEGERGVAGSDHYEDEDDHDEEHDEEQEEDWRAGLTQAKWDELMGRALEAGASETDIRRRVSRLIYSGGLRGGDSLRRLVWPHLLGQYRYTDTPEERAQRDARDRDAYERCGREWLQVERVVKQRDNEILSANMARRARQRSLAAKSAAGEPDTASLQSLATTVSSATDATDETATLHRERVIEESGDESGDERSQGELSDSDQPVVATGADARNNGPLCPGRLGDAEPAGKLQQAELAALRDNTDKSVCNSNNNNNSNETTTSNHKQAGKQRHAPAKPRPPTRRPRARLESTGSLGSDASMTDQFGNNVHRIDKDVQRCDRNFWYFKEERNLAKLRNVMCTYVWQHLDVGYVQGMCDLAAPFLVLFDDEARAFACFSQLMQRMVANFPHGNAMNEHFESLRYLMQVLDPKIFEILQSNGDYTHFYFCYRWLLLDFKRELAYEDVFRVWETIWAARHVVSEHFVIFMALAMVRFYRDIIIENNMDFTDTIKFFNEMAERHDAAKITALAQECVIELQNLIKCYANR